MTPRAKELPEDAERTSICLTIEDRAAIRWIADVRKRDKSKGKTLNAILVDALWSYLREKYGKTREEIQAMVPPPTPKPKVKVATMPKKGR